MIEQFEFDGFDEVYDVCQIFFFMLNSMDTYAAAYSLSDNKRRDVEYIENLINQFSTVKMKFKLLFDVEERKGVAFMFDYYANLKKLESAVSLDDFITILKGDEDFKRRVISYYLNESFDDDQKLQRALLCSCDELSVQFRYMLLQFVHFYDDYMEELFCTMQIIRNELVDIYKRYNQLLKRLNKEFQFELLTNGKRGIADWSVKISKINISFSLISQYVVLLGSRNETEGWMILGVNYLTLIEQKWDKEISVTNMCAALADETRFRIVKEIYERGDTTPSTIAKKFGLPFSVVCYHMDILKKNKIVYSRMKRRGTSFYLNNEVIIELSKTLAQLGGKNDELTEKMDETKDKNDS